MTKLLITGFLVGAVGLAAADGAPPPHKHHRPPQEAFDACAKSAKADPCAFKLKDQDVKGTCQDRRRGVGLVCRPAGPPPAPPAPAK